MTSGKLTPMKKYLVLRLFLARTAISHLVWSIETELDLGTVELDVEFEGEDRCAR